MSPSRHKPVECAQDRPLPTPSPSPSSAYGGRGANPWCGDTAGHLLDDLRSEYSQHNTESGESSGNPSFPANHSAIPGLGKPRAKSRISNSDLAVAATSLVCLAMAILAVANETVSWRLGVANNQLIVLGVLLSIINLCLNSVTSTFLVLIEARFGCSILQNYDGILRNKPMAPKLGLFWRLVLAFFVILPIAISVAYKTFKGGQSSKNVDSVDYVSVPTNYGMLAAPGLMQKVTGQKSTGLTQFFNATQTFRALSSPVQDSEPQLPGFPQPYGYNILLLNSDSTAVLDTLQPDFITSVQSILAIGESWVVNAPITGTVATLNTSKALDPVGFESAFQSACSGQSNANWTFEKMEIYATDPSSFWLFNQKDDLSDQSMQYMAFVPKYSNVVNCSDLAPLVQLYNIYRQQCQGTWSITRAGFELTNGSCDGGHLPMEKQTMIWSNTLKLTNYYMPALLEFLGPFGPFGPRNQSDWSGPYRATSVAAMLWSRIVTLNTIDAALSPSGGYNASISPSGASPETSNRTVSTWTDLGLIYPVNSPDQIIFYVRPTLRKSPLLYFVLAVQPLLIFVILCFVLKMHSVPLDRGFGLVSILSGIDRDTLDILSGASLSGELTDRVKLVMVPTSEGQTGRVALRAMPEDQGSNRMERLRRDVQYY